MRKNVISMTVVLILLAAAAVRAEVLDRIVAVINGRTIITLSDIRKERLILSALQKPVGTQADIRESLVQRQLVEEQIAQFAGTEVSAQEIDERLAEIRNTGGLSSSDLRQAVVSEIRLSKFIIQRFQQFIRVSEEEVQEYYRTVLVPSWKRDNSQPRPVEDVARDIQREIAGSKVDKEVMTWLEDLRRRNDVEIFE
jgi:hypothetical protein